MNPVPVAGATSAQSHPPKGAPAIRRKKPTSDPFFSGPKVRPPAQRLKPNGQAGQQPNGHPPRPLPYQKNNSTQQRPGVSTRVGTSSVERVSGFSDPQVAAGSVPYTDYKLVTTKKDLLDGLRFHILQLTGDKTVDIRDDDVFPKPARLYRRDPYAAPPGEVKEETFDPKDGLNAAEREDLNRRKEIRQREREANLAQIAPSQSSARKVPQFKKKSQQVFRADLTEEDKKRIQTNYEEKLPWHLEDFDNKHCFVGKNQNGSTNMHVGFLYEPAHDTTTSKFRLIPIEKLYHFKRKNNYKYLNAEEAEAAMNSKKPKLPQWLEDVQSKRTEESLKLLAARQSKTLFSGAQMSNIAGRQGEEADLDFEEDFADDEEGGLFEEKNDDEKLAEKKIKEDLLRANVFDMKLAKEYDEEEEKEKLEELARKEGSKKIRKALERRERNFNHGSDSEEDSATDSDEERERLEQEKLENVKKEEGEDGKASGLASGTNTPSARKEKISGMASDREAGVKKSSSNKSLKRPGSPNLSDASGTDTSTRKKHKSRHPSSSQPTPGISRPHSPANVPTSSAPGSKRPRPGRIGTDNDMAIHSEREGTATSDGERKRIKLKITSPGASRPTSPGPNSNAVGSSISRPNSTAPADQGSPSEPPPFPTVDDIRAEIKKGGMTPRELLRLVRHQPESRRREFGALVQSVARLNKETKFLEMKDQAN